MMYIKPPEDSVRHQGTERRSVLKGIGTALAGATMASFAGCIGGDDDEGDVGDREEVRDLHMVTYTPDEEIQYTTYDLIAEQIEELGFNVDFDPMNWNRHRQLMLVERDYDLSGAGYAGRPERMDPHLLFYRNNHSSNAIEGGYNWSNFVDERADELLDKQAETLDEDERQGYIHEAQEYIMSLPPGEIPIVHDAEFDLMNTGDFEGWINMSGIGHNNFWNWMNITPTGDRDTFIVASSRPMTAFNPLQSGELNVIINRCTHDTLVKQDPEEGLPTEWLATDWETDDDDMGVTFHLRDDLPEWHDGEQMTVDDIVFTYDYLLEWSSPYLGDAIEPIAGIEAVDDSTVYIEMERVFAPVFPVAFGRIPIMPQHIWENVPDEVDEDDPSEWTQHRSELTDEDYIGSGPFRFSHWDAEEEIAITARDDGGHFNSPNIDEMIIRIVPEPSAQLAGASRGEIDFIIITTADPEVMEDTAADEENLTFEAVDTLGYDELAMNTQRDPFDREAVRGAIASVIPKDVIVEQAHSGYGTPAHSPVSPVLDFWHYEDVKQWTEEYDMEDAKEMLEDEGFLLTDDGAYYPEGYDPVNADYVGAPMDE